MTPLLFLTLLPVIMFLTFAAIGWMLRAARFKRDSWWAYPMALTLSVNALLLGLLAGCVVVAYTWSAMLGQQETKLGLTQAVITTSVQSPGAL
jgi:hypothetical protein